MQNFSFLGDVQVVFPWWKKRRKKKKQDLGLQCSAWDALSLDLIEKSQKILSTKFAAKIFLCKTIFDRNKC